MKPASKDRGPIIKGVTELDSVVGADRPAVPMSLLLVQSCITDLLECHLTALCDYGDPSQPGVRIDVFDLETNTSSTCSASHGRVLSTVWTSGDAAFRTSGHAADGSLVPTVS